MKEERGSWYLLTGLLIGIVLGLLYAWVVSPIQYVNTAPHTLRTDAKDVYRQTIALAYQSTGDLARAQARLNLLGDEDSALTLAEQAQRQRATAGDSDEVQALADLAAILGQAPVLVVTSPVPVDTQIPSETPTLTLFPTVTNTPTLEFTPTGTPIITPTATLTPTLGPSSTVTRTPLASATPEPTRTPLPSLTPTPTLAPPFVLDKQVQVCNPNLTEPQIQVFINNAAGIGVPGVEVILTWAGGQESFFTGLKLDVDIGYADYVMEPGVVYTLQVSGGGQIIPDLSIPECEDDNAQRYPGSWRLIFKHP
ncbi:MAG TPA: hypothetical protein DEH25_14360 [Chloroflexi bacterium]|nr:hypothetical protein [Chloroflexota bacterium]